MPTRPLSWWKSFKSTACHHALATVDKDDTLQKILGMLVKAKGLPEALHAPALKALRAREELASTGVGMGVAIPHVKVPGIQSAACSFTVLKTPIEWAAVDGGEVDIVFTILRPSERTAEHDPDEHLQMMRWVAGLGRAVDFRSFARQATRRSDLIDLLREHSPQ